MNDVYDAVLCFVQVLFANDDEDDNDSCTYGKAGGNGEDNENSCDAGITQKVGGDPTWWATGGSG